MSERFSATRTTLRRVWPALSMSLLLHAALWVPLPHATRLSGQRLGATSVMAVRLLPPAPVEVAPPLPAPARTSGPERRQLVAAELSYPTSSAIPIAKPPRREFGADEAGSASGGKVQDETRDRAVKTPALAAAPPAPAAPSLVTPARSTGSPYQRAARMDPGPQALDSIEPVYPPEAGSQEGVVVLRVLINEVGTVDGVQVVRSSPPGWFERSAVTAFAAARFSPGRVLGVAIKSEITVEVAFTPVNRGATVSGRGY